MNHHLPHLIGTFIVMLLSFSPSITDLIVNDSYSAYILLV
jgi:hypothetical protein